MITPENTNSALDWTWTIIRSKHKARSKNQMRTASPGLCFRTNKPALRYAPRCRSLRPPPSCRRSGSAGASGSHTPWESGVIRLEGPPRPPSPTHDTHPIQYSMTLSATSSLPLNTPRAGDSPTPRAAHSKWNRPRCPAPSGTPATWVPGHPRPQGAACRRSAVPKPAGPRWKGRASDAIRAAIAANSTAPRLRRSRSAPRPCPGSGAHKGKGRPLGRAARRAEGRTLHGQAPSHSGPERPPGQAGRGGAHGALRLRPGAGRAVSGCAGVAAAGRGPEAPRCRWGWGRSCPAGFELFAPLPCAAGAVRGWGGRAGLRALQSQPFLAWSVPAGAAPLPAPGHGARCQRRLLLRGSRNRCPFRRPAGSGTRWS